MCGVNNGLEVEEDGGGENFFSGLFLLRGFDLVWDGNLHFSAL